MVHIWILVLGKKKKGINEHFCLREDGKEHYVEVKHKCKVDGFVMYLDLPTAEAES